MRTIGLAAAFCTLIGSVAFAQTAMTTQPPPAPAATLTPEVKALNERLAAIDRELRQELTVYFGSGPYPALNPGDAAAKAVKSGAAYNGRPLTENQRLLQEERNKVLAGLKAAAPAPTGAPVTLTAAEIRTLRAKIEALHLAIRKELTDHYKANPGPRSPLSMTDAAMASGEAFSGAPVSEKHRVLVAERAEVAARLLSAGEPLERPRRGASQAPAQALGPRVLPTPQQPAAWR